MTIHDRRLAKRTCLHWPRLEIKADGDEGAEPDLRASLEALKATLETVLAKLATVEPTAAEAKAAREEVKSLKTAIEAMEVKMNRPGAGGGDKGPSLEQKAFLAYCRRGRDPLTPEEQKALRIADDVAGGYIVAPDEFLAEVLKEIREISPIRRLARTTTISTGGVRLPRRLTGPAAWWVDEIEERQATDKTFGQAHIPVHEAASYIDVSQQLLEDAAVDIESELREDFAEAFAELEADAFTNGDGIKKPSGFMVDPGVLDVANGDASELQPDALIELYYSVPDRIARKAVWAMNRATMGVIRKMKDTQGRYLWQDGLTADQPPTLLGRPVEEFPDFANVGPGARPIAFGDFNDAYRIFDRLGTSILRDPYTLATKGQVRFHFRRRVGGGVVKPDAIRTLKIVTSL